MSFLDELSWRGMLHNQTPGIEEALQAGPITGYIGFDATASSLTIGNLVQIMLLNHFQRAGHRAIALLGGATSLIGDPSGKDQERSLKSKEQILENLEAFTKQFHKLLRTADESNPAIILNNFDFYKDMNVLDFLRDVGKSLTVNYMMKKESVSKRIETGISFTEFSYQLLQAYDFVCLHRDHNCVLQMGGSDQWGNITSGTELLRKISGGKAYAVTTPLLTKSDGKKFGKSEEGNIWLDPTLTSPYKFYQFWINCDDQDLPKLFRYFSFKGRHEVERLEEEYADNPQALKKVLAEELTRRIHSDTDYENVLQVTELIFNKKANRDFLFSLSEKALSAVSREIPMFNVPRNQVANGISLIDLMAEFSAISASKSEARKAIKGNAVSVNKEKVNQLDATLNTEALLHGKYIIVENGKKNKFMIVAE